MCGYESNEPVCITTGVNYQEVTFSSIKYLIVVSSNSVRKENVQPQEIKTSL